MHASSVVFLDPRAGLRESVGSSFRTPSLRNSTSDAPVEGGGTATLDRELEELLNQEQMEPGDHERFSHYVQKEKILESAISGQPVIALCGKVWLPGRDPQKFPVCPTCKEIYENLKK